MRLLLWRCNNVSCRGAAPFTARGGTRRLTRPFAGAANQVANVCPVAHGGDPDRDDVSQLFLQPFVSYALGDGQTLSANLEATHDWEAEQWSVPFNFGYSKVFSVGDQPMSFQIGGKKYLATPPGGPDWGVRSTLTFLFPDK